jgi:FKBP-type peptidyl-prolyl cis-trans isomerase SlyD
MADEMKIADDVVVALDYTLYVDGREVDSSQDADPIEFIQGRGQIIGGLERQLYGMTVEESRRLVVPPAEGYGEVDDQARLTFDRQQLPDGVNLAVGAELELRDDDGNVYESRVLELEGDQVRLDFNHPLAGKELTFEVRVAALRTATAEELDHGHVHQAGGHAH